MFLFQGHEKAVNTLKFSPDGKWVASGAEDGSVKVNYLIIFLYLSKFLKGDYLFYFNHLSI